MSGTEKKKKKSVAVSCEDCVYYDYDEYTDDYSCQMSLDEDEAVRFMQKGTRSCPFYRFHDEYLTVRKQN